MTPPTSAASSCTQSAYHAGWSCMFCPPFIGHKMVQPLEGTSPTTTASRTTECTAPEMGLRPPARMLTTVRIVAPAPATPPNNPEMALPRPCRADQGLHYESLCYSSIRFANPVVAFANPMVDRSPQLHSKLWLGHCNICCFQCRVRLCMIMTS